MLVITGKHGGCKSASSGNQRETAQAVGDDNGLSRRDPWVVDLLMSHRVTHVAQHLALVIFHHVDPNTRSASLSVNDLVKITNWGRETVQNGLLELHVVMDVERGHGNSAPSVFQLKSTAPGSVSAERQDADRAEAAASAGLLHIVPPAPLTAAEEARAQSWAVWSKSGGACTYCGTGLNPFQRHAPNGFQIDHVHPRSRGGSDAIENLVPACKICNCSKRDRPLSQWKA